MRRAGFTLIEVIIAAFIFAVGVLALEATAAGALREIQRSTRVRVGVSLARNRIEKLSGSSCSAIGAGADTLEGVIAAWWVSGAGAGSRVLDQAVTYRIDGVDRIDRYRSAVPCR